MVGIQLIATQLRVGTRIWRKCHGLPRTTQRGILRKWRMNHQTIVPKSDPYFAPVVSLVGLFGPRPRENWLLNVGLPVALTMQARTCRLIYMPHGDSPPFSLVQSTASRQTRLFYGWFSNTIDQRQHRSRHCPMFDPACLHFVAKVVFEPEICPCASVGQLLTWLPLNKSNRKLAIHFPKLTAKTRSCTYGQQQHRRA